MTLRNISVKDLRHFIFISDPMVSPDGENIAFVHTEIDHEKDCYKKNIT